MARSPEYYKRINSPEWRKLSKSVIASVNGRCVLLPFLKAKHTHHMTYRHLGHEKPLRDVVPLSKPSHDLIHTWLFWKTPLRGVVNAWLRLSYFIMLAVTPFVLITIALVKVTLWLLNAIGKAIT